MFRAFVLTMYADDWGGDCWAYKDFDTEPEAVAWAETWRQSNGPSEYPRPVSIVPLVNPAPIAVPAGLAYPSR